MFDDLALICVSIHAPAKGAKLIRLEVPEEYHVSIHAPAKGANHCCAWRSYEITGFNPRPREGSEL